MNILFLTDNFPPESNAPANRTFEHAVRWINTGHSVTVITCAPNFPAGKVYEGYKNKWYQVETLSGIRVVRVKTYMTANERFNRRVVDFASFMVMGSIAALFQKKPDVIIATSPQFFCGVAGMISAAARRVPFVLEVRDLWPDSILALGVSPSRIGVRFLKYLEGLMYRRASTIIVVSKAFVDPIQKRIPDADKIRIVTNGVNIEYFSTGASKKHTDVIEAELENKFVVAYIGTHGRSHGLLTIIKAAEAHRENKDIKFVLIGTGEKRNELIEWSKERHLDNIEFLPLQTRDTIPHYISLCDVALIPLRNLPLFRTVIPSKIFEFMASGKAMIVGIPRGECTKIIEKYQCGIVIEPENSTALSNAITSVYNDRNLLLKLSQNSKRAALDYERTKKADEMISYIEKQLIS